MAVYRETRGCRLARFSCEWVFASTRHARTVFFARDSFSEELENLRVFY